MPSPATKNVSRSGGTAARSPIESPTKNGTNTIPRLSTRSRAPPTLPLAPSPSQSQISAPTLPILTPSPPNSACNLADFADIVSTRAQQEGSRGGSVGSGESARGGSEAEAGRKGDARRPSPTIDGTLQSTTGASTTSIPEEQELAALADGDPSLLMSPTRPTSANREGFGTPRHSALDALAIAAAGAAPGSGAKTRKASASLSAAIGAGGAEPSGKKRRVNDGSAVQVPSSEAVSSAPVTTTTSQGNGHSNDVLQPTLSAPATLPNTLMWGETPLDPSLAPGAWSGGLLGGTRESSIRGLGALGFESEAFDPSLQDDQEPFSHAIEQTDVSTRRKVAKGKAPAYGGLMDGQMEDVGNGSAFTSPVSNISSISPVVPNSASISSNGHHAPTTGSSTGGPGAPPHRSFKTSTPIIPGRPDNPPPAGHVRSHSLNQYQLSQSAMAGPSSQNSSVSARSGSKNNKHRAVGSKTIYTNQANVSATDPNVKYYKPNFTYHELITHEIKRSPEGRLQLSEIYKRISERYPYFKLGEPGWQNSIRHNLSLKKCFVRVDRPTDAVVDKSGKGGWWTYTPGTTEDGRPAGRKGATGKGTGEYRKGSTPSDIASRSPSPNNRPTIEGEREAEHAANAAETSALLETATMSLAQMSENPSEGMFDYGANSTDISEMARMVQSQQQQGHGGGPSGPDQKMPPFADQPMFDFTQPLSFDGFPEPFPESHH